MQAQVPFDQANSKPVNVFLNVMDLVCGQICLSISWARLVLFLPPQPSWHYQPCFYCRGLLSFLCVFLSLLLKHTHTHTHTSEHHYLTEWHASCAEGSTADKQTHRTTTKNWFQVSKAELSTENYLHKAATHELASCLIDLPFLTVQPGHSLLFATP